MENRTDLLYRNIERYDQYIERADNKSSFLLAFFSAVLGLLLSDASELVNIFKDICWINTIAILIYIFVIIKLLNIIYKLVRVLYPRFIDESSLVDKKYKSLMFFGDVSDYNKNDYVDYIENIKKLNDDELITELSIQTIELSKICNTKMELLRSINSSVLTLIISFIILFGLRILGMIIG